MAGVIPNRMTAEIEGDFVVFLIGMRINKPLKVHKWLPVFRAMWVDFNKRIGASRGDVGIWHETYQVRAGEYETVYSGMPPHGLGQAGTLVPASGHRDSARGRMGTRQAV